MPGSFLVPAAAFHAKMWLFRDHGPLERFHGRRVRPLGGLMPGLGTDEIMQIALDMADMLHPPADSAVYVEGTNLQKVMFGIDIGTAELLLAKELGCDGVIGHHPVGGTATLNFPEVLTRHVELMVEHGVSTPVARDAIQSMMTRRAPARTVGELRSRAVGGATAQHAVSQRALAARRGRPSNDGGDDRHTSPDARP